MKQQAEDLSFLMGVKLKALRQQKNMSLTDLAEATGLSISYLSEIEKGKKSPKLEKLLQLSQALGVRFDDIVTTQGDDKLDPLKEILESPFMREMPLDFFGIRPRELLHHLSDDPDKARALLRAVLEIRRVYDVRVEHFFFAVLRTFQQMNRNYFADIEQAAARFRTERQWKAPGDVSLDDLEAVLTARYDYTLGEIPVERYPDLKDLRTIWVPGKRPTLLLNRRLMPTQRAFILGREIGYRVLDLKEQAVTSSWLRAESFDHVLNAFKASYFSGAVLMPQDAMLRDLSKLFKQTEWNGDEFLDLMKRYRTTPEMLFYRLTELLPHFLGFDNLFFLRFHKDRIEDDNFRLTKIFNLTNLSIPYDYGVAEHHCRRWTGITILGGPSRRKAASPPDELRVAAERQKFMETGDTYFTLSVARSLALSEGVNSSVGVGILIDDNFRRTVRFWNDSKLPDMQVNLTCERCPLPLKDCRERAAPAFLHEKEQRLARREQSLQNLLREYRPQRTK